MIWLALYLAIGLACVVVCWADAVDVWNRGLWLMILLLWPLPLFFGLLYVLKHLKDKLCRK